MDARLVALLQPAYAPCGGFATSCREMRWQPANGHIPRGFLGATGNLEEVELVLVFAEPGDHQPDERHTGLDSALRAAYHYHHARQDHFHRNVARILHLCWPNLSFDEQLRKVWMTESVLCSAPVESGPVNRAVERACGERYLLRQLELFPHALIVAVGNKATRRLQALGFTRFLPVSAAAPPEGNKPRARASWETIPVALEKIKRGEHPECSTPLQGNAAMPAAPRPERAPAAQPMRNRRDDLTGSYQVIDRTRLKATPENDPAKWALWQHIWNSSSFEELAKKCPNPVTTSRTGRTITWRSEARWALDRGWIVRAGDG